MVFDPIRFPAALLGTATLITLVQLQPAAALSAVEVGKTAKSITVLIEGQGAPGSGTIIARKGNTYSVLTAKHVVANINPGEEGYIIPHDGQRYRFAPATIRELPGVDLATIEFRSDRNYETARLGNADRVTEGAIAYISGFPLPTAAINRSIYSFTEGKIMANASQPLEDGYGLIYNNVTLPGMSGGPVLNDRGELIGIHGRADTVGSQMLPDNPDIHIKTGFNLGIPLKPFLHLLPQLGRETPSPAPYPDDSPTAIARAENLHLQGLQSLQSGNARKAIKAFDRAIQLNPDLILAYSSRGVARLNVRDYEGAIEDYNRFIRANPDDAIAYYNRAVGYVGLKSYAAAIKDYTQSIQLNRQNADAYYNRAIALVALKQYRRSVSDYTEAIRLDPGDPGIYNNRGAALRHLGDHRGAISDYNRAVQLRPDYAEAYYNRGIARYYLKEIEGAIADFQKAASLFRRQGNMKGYKQAIDNVNVLKE